MCAETRVVVLGAGFGGLHAAFSLRQELPHAMVTVLSRSGEFFYRPDSIYIPFGLDPATLTTPLQGPLRNKGIHFIHGEASSLDVEQRVLHVKGHRVEYNYLLLATGSTSLSHEFPGLTEHGLDITSSWQLLSLRRAFLQALSNAGQGQRTRVLFLLPPGNRFPGPLFEIALMLDTWLIRQDAREWVDIVVATWEDSLFAALGPAVHQALETAFASRGIDVRTRCSLAVVRPGRVLVADDSLPFDTLVTFPARAGTLGLEGLPYGDRRLVRTQTATRQAEGLPEVFVVGDVAADQSVKQAFMAFKQADVAVHHLVCAETGAMPTLFYDETTRYVFDTMDEGLLVEGTLDGTSKGSAAQSRLWHTSKQMLGRYLAWKVRHGQPFVDLLDRKLLGNTLRAAALSSHLDD